MTLAGYVSVLCSLIVFGSVQSRPQSLTWAELDAEVQGSTAGALPRPLQTVFRHQIDVRERRDQIRPGQDNQPFSAAIDIQEKELPEVYTGKDPLGESYTVIDEHHLEPVNPDLLPYSMPIEYVPVAEIVDKPAVSTVKVKHHHPSGSHVFYETTEYRPHRVAVQLVNQTTPPQAFTKSIISHFIQTSPHVYRIPIEHQQIDPPGPVKVPQDRHTASREHPDDPQMSGASLLPSEHRGHSPDQVVVLKDHLTSEPIRAPSTPNLDSPKTLVELPDILLYGKHSVVSQAFHDEYRQIAPDYVRPKQKYLGPYPFEILPQGGKQLKMNTPTHAFERTYYTKPQQRTSYLLHDRLYRSK